MLPPVIVMLWPAARTVSWLRFMVVALVVPMFRATAVAVSTRGVVTLVVALKVAAWPVPEMRKLAVWSKAFWFWMKLVVVGARTVASQVLTTPAFVHSNVVLLDV